MIPRAFIYDKDRMSSIRFDYVVRTKLANTHENSSRISLFVSLCDSSVAELEGEDVQRFMLQYKAWLTKMEEEADSAIRLRKSNEHNVSYSYTLRRQ